MKAITILRLVLAFGLLPITLGAQSIANDNSHNEPVNYYAEYADLMHGEMDAKPGPVAIPYVNRFPDSVHYRTVMNGNTEDFLAYYDTIKVQSVPAADAVFASWVAGGSAFKPRLVEDCSGR